MIARIGKDSMADENGYDFSLLLSWLEDIETSEQEKAETRPRYKKRLEKLQNAIQILQEIQFSEPVDQNC